MSIYYIIQTLYYNNMTKILKEFILPSFSEDFF